MPGAVLLSAYRSFLSILQRKPLICRNRPTIISGRNIDTMQRKLLMGDDHPMIRKGLRVLFDYYFEDIEVKEACSCNEIMRELSHSHYSHLVLDIVLADGTILEILPNIVSLYPH